VFERFTERARQVVRDAPRLPRAMLALEREGTSVYITSETLPRERVIAGAV